TEVQQTGTLVLALERDHAELDRFAARTRGHRQVTAAEIAELEPELAPRHRRGLFFESEACLHPRRALADLVAALAAEGVPVQRAEATPGELSGRVLDCRGFAAQGDLPDLRAVRGELVLLRAPEIKLSRP